MAGVSGTHDEFLDGFVSQEVAALEVYQKPQTLAQWRSQGKGPPWFKIGRGCFYTRRTLREWCAKQRREPGAGNRRTA